MSYSSLYLKNNIRMYISDLTIVAQNAIEKQATSPLPSLVLATAVAAFGPFAILKARGKTSVLYKPNGAIKNIVVESNSDGDIRALIGNPQIPTEYDNDPEKDINTVPMQIIIGDGGTMKVVHTYEDENFGGEVPLAKCDIVTDLAYYFDQSEQIYTAIITDVKLATPKSLDHAHSVIFQMLPDHTEEDIAWLENFIATVPLSSLSIEDYAKAFDGQYMASKQMSWKCTCSELKMKNLVGSLLSESEREKIIKEVGFFEITCNFCNTKYRF